MPWHSAPVPEEDVMSTRTRVLVSSIVAGFIAGLAGPAAAQGEPLFQSQHFTGPSGSESLAAGDLDGDGDVDLVAGGSSQSRVLLNAGQRVFVPASTWAGGGTDVSLGDLDGDGVLDLVVTAASTPAVRVRLGLGDGAFGAPTSYAIGTAPAEVELADLDLDGDLDLVVGQLSSSVKILLNDGQAAFAFALDVGPAGVGEKRIEVADLDGDALPDLAVSSTGFTGGVSLFSGLGDGGFRPSGAFPSSTSPADLAAEDLDLDGDVDLALVAGASNGQLLVFANDGDGGFSGPAFAAPMPFQPRFLAFADVDEDGILDALVSQPAGGGGKFGFTSGGVHVLLGAGDLSFDAAPSVAATTSGEIAVTDLDGDGDLDFGVAESLSGRVAVAWGEGDGTFRKGPALTGSGQDAAVDDMNGDGRPDLVATTFTGAAVALNVGNGHLPAVLEQTSVDYQFNLVTGDVDGDGDPDVVSANATANPGGSLWLNDGTGALAPPTLLAVPPRMNDVAAADLDLDGDLDFVFAAQGGSSPAQGTVQVLLGLGNGSFLPAVGYAAPNAMQAVAIADMDLDGVPDIVSSSQLAGLHVLLGNGDGTFAPPISGPIDFLMADLVVADFDGDGAPDVAYTRLASVPMLAVKLGNGDGTLGPAATYGPSSLGGNLAVGDIDHDGVLDLVVAQSGLSVFLGAGDGSFALAESVAVGPGPVRVALADLDGDGWTDVAGTIGGDFAREAFILRNQHGPWNDLGHPLAGAAGLPRQTGESSLIGGQPYKFTLRDAKPLTKAYHVVGIGTLNAPFKGGVMVPTINFVNPFPITNAQGEVTLAGHWITFPPGFVLYFQFWLPDPAGVAGFAASNAISATMP